MADTLPVLWIYGPAGVGKTTAGWALYARLAARGMRVGFIDIDQIGMCYGPPTAANWAPEPADDPVRYRLKAMNLDAIAAQHRAFGSRCLIAGGILDPEYGVDPAQLPNAELALCRLRADPDELARRIASRGRESDDLSDALRDDRALDSHDFPGALVDTTGLSVDEVLARIIQAIGGWPGPDPIQGTVSETASGTSITHTEAPGEILFLCGPTAVGKSTVAWATYHGSRRLGQHTAFADLDQLGFQAPVQPGDPRSHRLKAANLAALWRNFHARGARRLVVNGPLDRSEELRVYADALPATRITVCRLHASYGQLRLRIAERAAGAGSARGMAGDTIVGREGSALREIAERAEAEAQALERARAGDLRVVTEGRAPADIAVEVLGRAGWA